jgi:PAS domain S-box-containing protein
MAEPLPLAPIPLGARVIDAVRQGVIATDLDGRVIFWNRHAERLYGWTREEAIGRSILDLTPSETARSEAATILDRLARGEAWAGEFAVQRKNGSHFTAFVVDSPLLDDDGRLVGIIGVSTDVSSTRALEAQLQQAQKMEAVGRLAGGIAHDFNNLLTVILGNLDEESVASCDSDEVRTRLREARDAATRAAQLTRQLLAFSRRQHIRPRLVDLAGATRTMLPMLRRLIGEDVHIGCAAPPVPLYVVIDPSQFDQLLVNLAVNARDAMPGGGALQLTMDLVRNGEDGHSVVPDEAGNCIRLVVHDTGVGIAPDVLPRIFEPFFTTKEVGSGTGLGLATVYSLIEQAGGTVTVRSTPGHGTTFTVLLPRAAGPASDAARPRDDPPPSAPLPETTVLVAEDEPALRKLVTRILQEAGYQVLAAANGEEALARCAANCARVKLVLSDIVMPGLGGLELADRMREHCPDTPILFMTGYAADELAKRGSLPGGRRIINKPFSRTDLLAAVREVLVEA